MADFALWATACETALRSKDGTPWPKGTFWAAYSGNRDEAVEGVIDADPVATAVRAFMAKQAAEQAAAGQAATQTVRTVWTGIASDLLGALAEVVGERVAKSKTWPDSPRALSGRLRRAATFLRKIGIDIAFTKEGRARTRTITITDQLFRARKAGGIRVRIVRIVRQFGKSQFRQWLLGSVRADANRDADANRAMRTVAAKATIRPSAPTP